MRRLPLALVALLGCAGPLPPGAEESLADAPRLEAIGDAVGGPEGSDAPARWRVGFVDHGVTRPVDREAIAFVPRWREGAALVDPQRRLYAVRPDGDRRMLAADAVGVLATDGARLAYVTERGGLSALSLHDGTRPRVIVEGFASIGVVRLTPEEILFVGAPPGGVVGVWSVQGGAPVCLTNCALRTGEPWADRFVPPPVDAATFVIEPGRVRWVDGDGVAREVGR